MALPPNPKLEGAIANADTDTLAVAYALLRVAEALRNLDAQNPPLVAALNHIASNVANRIEDGADKIANAIDKHKKP